LHKNRHIPSPLKQEKPTTGAPVARAKTSLFAMAPTKAPDSHQRHTLRKRTALSIFAAANIRAMERFATAHTPSFNLRSDWYDLPAEGFFHRSGSLRR